MRHIICCGIFVFTILMITGCRGTKPLVTELKNETVTYEENIRINNCGNKAESVQTATRSFSTKIEGTGSIKADFQVVEGGVEATYGEYKEIIKSQTLTAAPNTNMEFVLRWAEDIRSGEVTVEGKSTNYSVHIPVSVEQLSSEDFGCSGDMISMSSLTGDWTGTIKSPDGSFSTELNLSFDEDCQIGEECGRYEANQLSCSGKLTLVEMDSDTFIFLETRLKGEDWCGFCYEHIQVISGSSISYGCSSTGKSQDIQSTGVLTRP